MLMLKSLFALLLKSHYSSMPIDFFSFYQFETSDLFININILIQVYFIIKRFQFYCLSRSLTTILIKVIQNALIYQFINLSKYLYEIN